MDVRRPYAFFVEPERSAAGRVEDVATIFTSNKECGFRCLMCDLWKNTTVSRTPAGAVAEQVEWALGQLPETPHVKLYNAGSFFDEQSIPVVDRHRMVELVGDRRTVIVECHPKLIDRRCQDFAGSMRADLEVAMGLETVDPEVLPRLNKGMTLDDFARATDFLVDHGVRVRAFILLRTPYQSEEEGVDWARRSIDFAFSIGVECCAVIPTRAGNGAMEELRRRGEFHPPSLRSMEVVMDYGLALGRGRVLMDLWDVEKFARCSQCLSVRTERLRAMNLSQEILPRVPCDCE